MSKSNCYCFFNQFFNWLKSSIKNAFGRFYLLCISFAARSFIAVTIQAATWKVIRTNGLHIIIDTL